ncbi:MAG: class I SAM-dependent methyltransferase [Myxococcota bacterium]
MRRAVVAAALGGGLAGAGIGFVAGREPSPRRVAATAAAETVARLDAGMPPPLAELPAESPRGPSLFHVPQGAEPELSKSELAAGAALRGCLAAPDAASCTTAARRLADTGGDQIWGNDWPALRWAAAYLAAGPEEQAALREGDGGRFVALLGEDGWLPLRTWTAGRFGFKDELKRLLARAAPAASSEGGGGEGKHYRHLGELVRAANPARAQWERIDEGMAWLAFRPGEAVAVPGARTGWLALRVADAVGEGGKVYATDPDGRMVAVLERFVAEEGRENVVVEGRDRASLELPDDAVDTVVMDGTFAAVYGSLRREERADFYAGLVRALRPGGRLVVIENTPEDELPPGVPPAYGAAISSSLVVAQLESRGFTLRDRRVFVPQRYLLVFTSPKVAPASSGGDR